MLTNTESPYKIVKWGKVRYKVTRNTDGHSEVFMEVVRTGVMGTPLVVWMQLFGFQSTKFLERLALETLGLTQEKRLRVVEG